MRNGILILAIGLGLAACSDQPSKVELNSASIALMTARNAAAEGKPVDRAALEAMPGLHAVLEKEGRDLRERLAQQMRDPSSVIWGELWTVDYVHICGEVNAKNGFGGYTGKQMFYAPEGLIARLPDHPLWELTDLEHCVGGQRRLILPADTPQA